MLGTLVCFFEAVERVVVVQPVKPFGEMSWRRFVSPPFSQVFLPPPGRSFLICAFICRRMIRRRIRPIPPSSFSLAGSFVCLLFLWWDFQSLSWGFPFPVFESDTGLRLRRVGVGVRLRRGRGHVVLGRGVVLWKLGLGLGMVGELHRW